LLPTLQKYLDGYFDRISHTHVLAGSLKQLSAIEYVDQNFETQYEYVTEGIQTSASPIKYGTLNGSTNILYYPNAKNLGSNNEYGLFSDRKSALNFRNNILVKVMDEQGDKIMDILSIINMKANKSDDVLNFYKNVKLNYLYRSEIPHYINSAVDVEKYFFRENCEKDIRS
jgi:hypothetical protein